MEQQPTKLFSKNVIQIIRFFISFIALSLIIWMYIQNRNNHPYCFWNGNFVDGLDSKGKVIQHNTCQYNDCDKMMCNMLTNGSSIAFVRIELLEPTLPSPKYTYNDMIWIIIIILASLNIFFDSLNVFKMINS